MEGKGTGCILQRVGIHSSVIMSIEQDIYLIFFPNGFVLRLEISQQAILIGVVMSGGCFEAPWMPERSSQIFELSRLPIGHRSPWPHADFTIDKFNH